MDYPQENWRSARRALEETFEREMLSDRECGKLPAGLTGEQIRRMAYEKAIATLQRVDNERGEQERLRRIERGEAA